MYENIVQKDMNKFIKARKIDSCFESVQKKVNTTRTFS